MVSRDINVVSTRTIDLVRLFAPCRAEHFKPPVVDVIVPLVTAVVDSSRRALDRRGGLEGRKTVGKKKAEKEGGATRARTKPWALLISPIMQTDERALGNYGRVCVDQFEIRGSIGSGSDCRSLSSDGVGRLRVQAQMFATDLSHLYCEI
ncbi:hypothetical protein EVAR_974_1 [Eumeta japonica]|uniref:Uncharacterized protein n=1 Tax=Eumeta variegata TaxID=151549 RepID=A0A4C1SH23_EUMVA|nr:hypothetical protein EVAR_974_1 [Eumeta japonica]